MADSKADVLQGLLDGQAFMLELFDAVEACEEGALIVDVRLLIRMRRLIDALDAAQSAMTLAYVMSGRAGDDVLALVRAELASEPE